MIFLKTQQFKVKNGQCNAWLIAAVQLQLRIKYLNFENFYIFFGQIILDNKTESFSSHLTLLAPIVTSI